MSLKRIVLAGLATLALATPLVVHAGDEDHDHDRARDLHEGGEIRALSEILAEVSRRVPGDIAAVDLVQSGKSWVYRIQIIAADGKRTIVDVDAGAGTPFHDQGRD